MNFLPLLNPCSAARSAACKAAFSLWLALAASTTSYAAAPLSLWPTIPFIRGQDLCQFQDAYGKSRSELAQEMAGRLKDLLSYGAEADEALNSLLAIEALITKNRRLATTGQAMDLTLEASLRAAQLAQHIEQGGRIEESELSVFGLDLSVQAVQCSAQAGL